MWGMGAWVGSLQAVPKIDRPSVEVMAPLYETQLSGHV